MFQGIDRILLALTILLVVVGFFIFSSASLGLLAREGAHFSSVALSQLLFGILGGSIALLVTISIHYRFWRQHAFYIFLGTLLLTFLVFVPGLGFSHGGAQRWINIAGFSFQPAELLKIGFVIYIATWLSGMRQHIKSFTKGTLPFLGIIAVIGTALLLQPDTDTFLIMCAAGVAMFIVSGGRIRDVIFMAIAAIILIAVLALTRPYIKDRIETFMNPSLDPQGSGYQVRQSLIAIGSGGVWGRGFGQSIQKFEYLPEPIGDSVFAVYSEEFGFVGSVILLLLFTGFTLRSYRIAARAPDLFAMILVVGISTLIISQALLNIAAMLAVAPLSGLPLPFISHGGSAMLVVLASVGIMLNISKHQKRGAL